MCVQEIYGLEKFWLIITNFKLNPEWTSILVTLLLGGTAIFQDKIRGWFYKPKLNLTCTLSSPDCHKIPLTIQIGNQISTIDSYYLRFRVENTGNQAMEDIEVKILSLYRKSDKNKYTLQENFLPMNLKWAHTGNVVTNNIQVGLFKHLDIGCIRRPIDNFDPTEIQSNIALFLDLETVPNTRSDIIEPGDYKIDLVVAGNNFKPVHKTYKLILRDEWLDNESDMLGKNIILEDLR
jgi:hypothetical protein